MSFACVCASHLLRALPLQTLTRSLRRLDHRCACSALGAHKTENDAGEIAGRIWSSTLVFTALALAVAMYVYVLSPRSSRDALNRTTV